MAIEKRADYGAVLQSLWANGSGIYRRLPDKPVKSRAKPLAPANQEMLKSR
jgi:hypothetical protein